MDIVKAKKYGTAYGTNIHNYTINSPMCLGK